MLENREVWVETLTPSTWACQSGSVDLLLSNFSHVHLKPAVSQCTNDNEHIRNACMSLPGRTYSFIPLRPSPIIFLPPKQISLHFLSSIFLIWWWSLEDFTMKFIVNFPGYETDNIWYLTFHNPTPWQPAQNTINTAMTIFWCSFTIQYYSTDSFNIGWCDSPFYPLMNEELS